MRIAVVRPGHALSTLFVSQGMESGLRAIGVDVIETRTENLIAAQSVIVKTHWDIFQQVDADANKVAIHIASELMLARLLYLDYDLLLVVNGRLFTEQIYRGMDKLPGPRVIWLTESPYEDDIQKQIAEHFDYAFVNDRISLPVIGEMVPTAYLPHSFNPSIYHPGAGYKKYDVFFAYSPFSNRDVIVDKLSKSELDCLFPKAHVFEQDGTVRVVFLQPGTMAQMYHSSAINLNVHRMEGHYGQGDFIREAHSLGPRAYEIAGCAEFQLCDNTRPELQEVFGDTVATFDPATDDIVEVCEWWLDPARNARRFEMGRASFERVAGRCAYEHRAQQVVDQLAEWYDRPDWRMEKESHDEEEERTPAAVPVPVS